MKLIIGASKNNKIGSKLIRWWIGAPYSHVYARWELKTQGRSVVYQASHGMVHFQSFANFTRDNDIVEEFALEVAPQQFADFSTRCIDLAGEPYSILELVQIFICDITNGKIKFADQHGYICSELLAELLEGVGVKLAKPTYLMTPKDIMENLRPLAAAKP
jgi:hypothetical protein